MGLLLMEGVESRFPDWRVSWEYGRYTATHDSYDASWEGEEDGWQDNGLKAESRTLEGLVQEIESVIEEHDL